MKYFILSLDKLCKFVPEIDDQAIRKNLVDASENKEMFLNLPDHLIIPITTVELAVWADILVSPVLMISAEVANLLKVYGDRMDYRDVILLEQKNATSKAYCLSKFERAKGSVEYKEKNGKKQAVIILEESERVNKWNNIFQVVSSEKLHTIINLDFAESLLRRNLDGIGLEEVTIIGIK